MKAILEDTNLFTKQKIVAPDIVVYEVANAIWKQEHLMNILKEGEQYIAIFLGLIKSGNITILSPNEPLIQDSYAIAKRNNITVYDAVFIALAIKLDSKLGSLDKIQTQIYKKEKNAKSTEYISS